MTSESTPPTLDHTGQLPSHHRIMRIYQKAVGSSGPWPSRAFNYLIHIQVYAYTPIV